MTDGFKVKCSICGTEFILGRSTYYSRIRVNPINTKFYCPQHKNIGRSNDIKEARSKLSDEEKEARRQASSERAKKQWASYDDNKRKEIGEIFSKAQKSRIENMPEEELREYKNTLRKNGALGAKNWSEDTRNKRSELSKQMWANRSNEERNAVRKKQSEGLKRYIDSLPEEEKAKRDKRLVEGCANLSPEKKRKISEKLSEFQKKRWDELSKDEKKARMEKIHYGANKYFSDDENVKEFSDIMRNSHASRSDEDKARYVEKMRSWLMSLTPVQYAEYNRRRLIRSSLKRGNSLDAKFLQKFNLHDLGDYLFYINEIPLSENSVPHSWDYGIYDQNGDLVMVADLDGEYFHGDKCDYDGLHCREEYDERRGFSVPNGVIPVIINEKNFDKCFDNMVKILSMTYEQYVDHMFRTYRKMPFPEPRYSDRELISSYEKLQRMDCTDKYHQDMSVNTRLGDRLILHFHPSIYHQSIDGHISPYDAWYDDNVLCQHIQDHILYHSYLNPNKILQGFNVSPIAPRIRFLSGGKCKMIINKYLMDYDVIFDPNMGYGGTMLGTVSLGKKFVGICKDPVSYRENMQLVFFLNKISHVAIDIKRDVQNYTYSCMFTTVDSDDAISSYIDRFKCNRYVFISRYTIKYHEKITDTIKCKSIYDDDKFVIVVDKE